MKKLGDTIEQTFGLAVLLLMLPINSQAAETLQEIKQKFVGDFELVSYFQFPEQGDAIDMNYVGRLSYDAFGNMSGLGMPRLARTKPRLAGENYRGFCLLGKGFIRC